MKIQSAVHCARAFSRGKLSVSMRAVTEMSNLISVGLEPKAKGLPRQRQIRTRSDIVLNIIYPPRGQHTRAEKDSSKFSRRAR